MSDLSSVTDDELARKVTYGIWPHDDSRNALNELLRRAKERYVLLRTHEPHGHNATNAEVVSLNAERDEWERVARVLAAVDLPLMAEEEALAWARKQVRDVR